MSMYHDVVEALTPLIEAFERLGIMYYIGGSVSSSLHGLARRTQDVDVIADIGTNQVHSLQTALMLPLSSIKGISALLLLRSSHCYEKIV